MTTETTTDQPKFMPKSVDDLDIAFGGRTRELLPPMSQIPDEFKNLNRPTEWNKLVSRWFFSGLPSGMGWAPKPGIVTRDALRHVGAIMGSFEPKHEHKEAGCAYLLSLWFVAVQHADIKA
jgi:hypothetical protein